MYRVLSYNWSARWHYKQLNHELSQEIELTTRVQILEKKKTFYNLKDWLKGLAWSSPNISNYDRHLKNAKRYNCGNIVNLVWFGWVLWHINHCRLFHAKCSLYIYIKYKWFYLIGFYGISTIEGYLMPYPLHTYILNIYNLVWLGFIAYQPF